jgi:hypothetical protein
MLTPRRFPPPWTIEEHQVSFIARDAVFNRTGVKQFELSTDP